MEKRAYSRIPVELDVRFYCCNGTYHSGTVTNLSEKGMFIRTKEMCFPFDSQLEIFIPLKKDEKLRVSVNLSRIIISPDSDDSIGVELPDPPREYLEFVKGLRSA